LGGSCQRPKVASKLQLKRICADDPERPWKVGRRAPNKLGPTGALNKGRPLLARNPNSAPQRAQKRVDGPDFGARKNLPPQSLHRLAGDDLDFLAPLALPESESALRRQSRLKKRALQPNRRIG